MVRHHGRQVGGSSVLGPLVGEPLSENATSHSRCRLIRSGATPMRIFLKVIAILIGLQVANTVSLVWRMARMGGLGELTRTGTLGVITMLGWVLALAVGPFAVVQLWRLKESGRRASLLLASFALIYYAAGLVFLRGPGAETAQIAIPIIGNLLLSLLLASSPVRRVCQNVKAAQESAPASPSAG
jgi:hypothetical protein